MGESHLPHQVQAQPPAQPAPAGLAERAKQLPQVRGRDPRAIVLDDQLEPVTRGLPQAELHRGGRRRMGEHVLEHLVERGLEQHRVAPDLAIGIQLHAHFEVVCVRLLPDRVGRGLGQGLKRNPHRE